MILCQQIVIFSIYGQSGAIRKLDSRLEQWPGELEQWPSGKGTGFQIQGPCVQNHWVAPRSAQPFIHLRLIK